MTIHQLAREAAILLFNKHMMSEQSDPTNWDIRPRAAIYAFYLVQRIKAIMS
jgi:hypothetical protein